MKLHQSDDTYARIVQRLSVLHTEQVIVKPPNVIQEINLIPNENKHFESDITWQAAKTLCSTMLMLADDGAVEC